MEQGRAGQVSELARDAALPQGPAALQPPPAPARPRHERGTVIAVEGYVDVIAMTRRRLRRHRRAARHGADRGPARRCSGGMSRRADPLLRRRQGRPPRRLPRPRPGAAAPRPGKSLRFALLPEGQDPDDLLRSGGAGGDRRGARRAPPLVDMLWRARDRGRRRSTRPSAAPAWSAACARPSAPIRDETLRRYYRDDIEERLRGLSPAAPRSRRRAGRPWRRPAASAGRGEPGRRRASPASSSASTPASAAFAGGRRRSREALIVAAVARPSGAARRARRGPRRARVRRCRRASACAGRCVDCAARGDARPTPEVLRARLDRGRARSGGRAARWRWPAPATAGRWTRMPIPRRRAELCGRP